MWHVPDGTLANFSHVACNVLNNTYHGWWIGRRRRTYCKASMLARFESCGFLPMGTPKNPCVCSSSWQWRGTSPLHFGHLSDYLQLLQHHSMDSEVHDETRQFVHHIQMNILSTYCKRTPSTITHKLNSSRHMLIQIFFSCFSMWSLCPKFVCTFQLHPVYSQALNTPYSLQP
jgi:hypothetical protein